VLYKTVTKQYCDLLHMWKNTSSASTRCSTLLYNNSLPHIFSLQGRNPPGSATDATELFCTAPINVLPDEIPVRSEIFRSLVYLKIVLWIK